MRKTIGIKEFLSKKFDTYKIDGKFLNTLGEPEKNFRMIIYGKSGNGKTEFAFQLAKYFASFAKVYYNSFEQGISKTLQDAILRNDMLSVSGRVVFGDKETFEDMKKRLRQKNSPQIVFIDSRDYLNLSKEQFKEITQENPRKAFVIISWEQDGKPKGEHAKAIEYMCDIKIYVKNFIAEPRSRFGGNEPYIIWDKGAAKAIKKRQDTEVQSTLFELDDGKI